MVDVLNVSTIQVKTWKDDKKDVKKFIDFTEQIGRDELSRMIGEKVIDKIFVDNLQDFKQQQDMGPIMMLCAIITKVLGLLKELDVK